MIGADVMSKESKAMSYEQIFQEVKQRFSGTDVSRITDHLAYQFNITGEGAGIFYVEVKEGKLYIEPYEYYDRDAIFTCKADTLFKIIEGKTDPVAAFTLQKLKVDGDMGKALRLKDIIASIR